MTYKIERAGSDERPSPKPLRIRMPGFVRDQDIGLGDVIRQTTYAVGIKSSCGGCETRAASLNRWVVFTR